VKENQDALDNIRGFAGVVGPWARHFLHDGRVHPYLVGPGDCYVLDPSHSGPQDEFLILEANS
jgi:hypothetical protein